jgi:hypothetical protein
VRGALTSSSNDDSTDNNNSNNDVDNGSILSRGASDILVSPRAAYASTGRLPPANKPRSATVTFGQHDFQFNITQFATVKSESGGKPFTTFVLEFVSSRRHASKVLKRYSDFADLHAELSSLFPTVCGCCID